jgi:hypothetical protein
MDVIWLDGRTSKEELGRRLDRAEGILKPYTTPGTLLPYRCANHLADALGCLAKCLLDHADRALDAAEQAAAGTEAVQGRRPRTYTLQDLRRIIRSQRESLARAP